MAAGRDKRGWYRELAVPEGGHGLRLDTLLARRFASVSRSAWRRAIRDSRVTDGAGGSLRPASTVRADDRLRIYLPPIAPTGPPPPFPRIAFEDDAIAVVDKPAGLVTHPTGDIFAWGLVGICRGRWPEVDLVHRIDRETSGLLVLSKDRATNLALKADFTTGNVQKEYVAFVRGHVPWDQRDLDGPIGPAGGPIRIQMAVRPDGLPSRTHVVVEARHPTAPLTRVRCRIATGRTHQIRVHLADAGFGLVGDRLYGVDPSVFLHAWEVGIDDSVIIAAGAPRHALHAARIGLRHPQGHDLVVDAPLPPDMQRWWSDPTCLPLDADANAEQHV